MSSASGFELLGNKFKVINFSGGRSSAYMLRSIQIFNDGIPDNAEVIFCNTGKELEATLDFVHECGVRWDIPITWLEYRYRGWAKGGISEPKNDYMVVDYESASRKGEPFAQLITKSSMLPNVMARKCTSELKVETIRRYMRSQHGKKRSEYINVLGIRYDEKRRVKKALMEECQVMYPLVYAQETIEHVQHYWNYEDFDLGIDSMYSNCDLCFLKGQKTLIETMRVAPALAQWWIEQEQRVQKKSGKPAHFSKRGSYKEMLDYAMSQQAIDFGDEPTLDCFCGD